MIYELSQKFYFDAAHTLKRDIDAAGSARIHGHTYHAEVTLSGLPDARNGMVIDLGWVRQQVDAIRDALDHRFLDEVEGLGIPTLENLCAFIATKMQSATPVPLVSVRVWREAGGDSCLLLL